MYCPNCGCPSPNYICNTCRGMAENAGMLTADLGNIPSIAPSNIGHRLIENALGDLNLPEIDNVLDRIDPKLFNY